MTAETISDLVQAIPDWLLPGFFPGGRMPSHCQGVADSNMSRFLLGFTDPSFGWRLAHVFATHDMRLPPLASEEDEPLMQAWLYVKTRRCTPQFMRALSMTHQLRREAGWLARALLLSGGGAHEEVARHLNEDPETIRVYEKLFFNLRDRRDDVTYVQQLVYPHTRVAEFFRTSYHADEAGLLLMRAGFDGATAQEVMNLAGGSRDVSGMMASAAGQPKLLEGVLMGGALMMAKAGLMHTRESHPLIGQARQLLSADKLGGNDQDGMDDGPSAIGHVLMSEMRRARLDMVRRQELAKLSGSVADA